jgi:hypothetical protein
MTEKPAQPLRIRLAAQLNDLRDGGDKDLEVGRLVGGLAAAIADARKRTNWKAAKKSLSTAERFVLLADIDRNILLRLKAREGKHVYAMQLIGISVAAAGEPELHQGEMLLDQYITAAEKVYRGATAGRSPAARPAAS